MKAIILAAGYGNRMKPLTDNEHKTLLKINGTAILSRIVSGLIDNNVKDIVIVTGYRHDDIVNFLTDEYKSIDFQFVYNDQYRTTNNIFSMALAFDNVDINEDVLLIESDLIYEPTVIERIIRSEYKNVALVCKYHSGLDGTVVKLKGETIVDVIPPHRQGPNFDFSDKFKTLNIYKFEQKFCNEEFKKLLTFYSKAFDDNCYYELILGVLIYMQREKVYCEIIEDEKWAEVDDPNDLKIAEFIFNKDNQLKILDESFGGFWNYDILDFCFIRNMYFPNDSMISEIKNNAPDLLRNYGSKQIILNKKLHFVIGLDKERLILMNGVAQVYPLLKTFFNGKKVLLPNPTFGEYTRVFRNPVTYDDKVGVNLEEVESKLNHCDVIVLVNPNNPTGSIINSQEIARLVLSYSDKFFIIDESFIEFSDQKPISDDKELSNSDNFMVIKSMSKTYGCPGIRLGYTYSNNAELNDFLNSNVPIWNINSFAEFMLEIILKNKRDLDSSFAKTKLDRDLFAKSLQSRTYIDKVFESGGNYILVRFDQTVIGELVREKLLEKHKIYVKDVSQHFESPASYFRIAVRSRGDNNYFLRSLDDVIMN